MEDLNVNQGTVKWLWTKCEFTESDKIEVKEKLRLFY